MGDREVSWEGEGTSRGPWEAAWRFLDLEFLCVLSALRLLWGTAVPSGVAISHRGTALEVPFFMDDTPFHEGEEAIQARYGLKERMRAFGSRVVRDRMPEQHQAFYEALPYLVIGAVDAHGRPWASMVIGEPGFLQAVHPRRLRVNALPDGGDPISAGIRRHGRVGVLGIELATRRRNRLTGRFGGIDGEGFEILVDQTFGNCPQYIRPRWLGQAQPISPQWRSESGWNKELRRWVETAQTFFIASAYEANAEDPRHGVDVSHRGGRPGFVHVADDGALWFPDFAGNRHFNTLGNLLMNPRCGLLFPDFEAARMLSLSGRAQVIEQHAALSGFAGAERFVRVEVDAFRIGDDALPWEVQTSTDALRYEQRTGIWAELEATKV